MKKERMTTLVLQSKSKKDMKILAALARKIGLKPHFLKNEYLEDIGLATSMKKGRTGEFIDTDQYLKKLRKREA
jgi:hypothetical protein